jgi:hypothetical protein
MFANRQAFSGLNRIPEERRSVQNIHNCHDDRQRRPNRIFKNKRIQRPEERKQLAEGILSAFREMATKFLKGPIH